MEWNDVTTQQLRTLWTQGYSANEIGRRMGCTKNAIVGRVHRLDLEARPSPIRRSVGYIKAPPSIPRARVTLPPLASYEPAPVIIAVQPRVVAPPPPAPAPINFRPRSQPCCWPIGEPKSKNFRFCYDPAPGGRPYCGEHAKLAYANMRDRREDAA